MILIGFKCLRLFSKHHDLPLMRVHMMNTVKQEVINILNKLPDDVDIDEIMYRLYVLDSIRKGLKDVEEGRTLTSEEVKQAIDSW